jgi:Protein of unknown function (DUF2809)
MNSLPSHPEHYICNVMSPILKFKRQYFILAVLLFVIEILIALFAHDRIVRPYMGDFFVVILIYCFLRSFLDTSVLTTSLSVLAFSYAVEILQYFNIAERSGLQNSRLAGIIIGSSFEWIDLISYTAGIGLVLYIEKIIAGKTHIKGNIKSA